MKTSGQWLDAIQSAEKRESTWRLTASKIIKIFRADDGVDLQGNRQKETFNILWSNVSTLAPALYNRTPRPDIRRRYADRDPVAKAVSDALSRSISYCMEQYGYDDAMTKTITSALLTGRGVVRVRYEPLFANTGRPDDAAEELADGDNAADDELAFERVCFEHVQWDDFRCEPCRTWDDVTWVAFRLFLTKQQLAEKFGAEVAEQIPCDHTSREQTGTPNSPNGADRDQENRGKVWEIWDKTTRTVVFIAPEVENGGLIIQQQEDPLSLDGFFPIPRPIYTTEDATSLVPVPDYSVYETLAEDLNRTTKRIVEITKAVRVRGIYDSTIPEIQHLYDSGETGLIPAQNVSQFIDRGGIDKVIWFAPLETLVLALRELYQHREIIKQSIYEITGVADIMRGQTAASETATAQQIKSQWGTIRLQRRQREVQRLARDLLRLGAEIIAERFSPETLTIMTGLQFATNEQKAQMQAMAQQGAELPPEVAAMMEKPSWDDLIGVMRDDLILSFRLDIETDSTIAADEAADKQAMTELMTGVSNFVATIGPAVASGYLPMDVAKQLLLMAVRKFKAGSEIEAEIEKIQQPPPQQQPQDNSLQVQQMQMQHEQQLKASDQQHLQQVEAMKAAVKQQEIQANERIAAMQAQLEAQKIENQRQIAMAEMLRAESRERESLTQ